MAEKKKLLLVDGSSLAFRAFYSILNLDSFTNQNGLHTNALFSFHRMFNTILDIEKPTHVLVAWDAGKTTFRTEMYSEYKGGRQNAPSEFREQMPYFNVMLDAFGASHYQLVNYEADDIIGTMAHQVDSDEFDVVVLSGDRDLIQLANDHVRVEITSKGVSDLVSFTPQVIEEKFGITPDQIIDMKGLMGDSSDNYPGVTKVGEKTALKLLHEFGSVEGIYDHIDDMKKSKLKENLENDKEKAFLSKTLARIDRDSPIDISINDTVYKGKNPEALMAFYKEMNFNQFQTELVKDGHGPTTSKENLVQFEVVEKVKTKHFETADTFHLEILTENYHVAKIVGVAWGNRDKVYISQVDSLLRSAAFKEWVENPTIQKSVFDSKTATVLLNAYQIYPKGIAYDISLLAYLHDTNDSIKDLSDIANKKHVGSVQMDEIIYGKGAKIQIPEVIEEFYQHLASKVEALSLLGQILLDDLEKFNQKDLYQTMELPLADVLARMEIQGIRVDADRLKEMGLDLNERLAEIEARIYQEAGQTFNINSPKQLGVILFDEMKLPVIKKTKTGYSTAVDVLEKLADQAPIVKSILEYRQLAKLKSTYIEGLLAYILEDGKIHTRYVQTLTQTGRLSSIDPNLQNIPIRTEEGRKIRYAFLPQADDWSILAVDYSQIELRVLAHISQDAHLIEAFNKGQDIHTTTAMRVFDIKDASLVTSEMRRQAKAVNFGIVYGISDYGLSQNLNISRFAAKEFIDRYFQEFPGVKQYMTDIVAQGKKDGFVETLFHRRRYLPDLHSSNFNIRSFAERTAMNSPIQGSAADILKIAMLHVDEALRERKLKSNMLLQVHDELIFEVPNDELAEMEELITTIMEDAVTLSIPLKVDGNAGPSWFEAK